MSAITFKWLYLNCSSNDGRHGKPTKYVKMHDKQETRDISDGDSSAKHIKSTTLQPKR